MNNVGSCSKIGIEPIVYARLKDDINIIVESLENVENGSKVVDGKIIIDFEKKKEDENKSDAKITIDLIKEVANKINPMIQ